MAESPTDSNRSTVKSFAVLELLGRSPSPLSLAEIARASNLHRTTAARFVATLIELGYVERSADGRHRLTARVLDLSSMYFNTTVLPNYAMPHLERFCHETGMSTSLAILDRTDVVYTARVSERRTLSTAVHIGSRLPAHATAIGKVLLSFLAPADLRGRYAGIDLQGRTNRTITDVDELVGAVAEVRRQGFSLSEEECEIGVRAIAAPLLNPVGELVAAVSVSSRTEERSRMDFLEEILPRFLRTADDITLSARRDRDEDGSHPA
jgi:IclR family transcriptional regulator, pca regulon regulatory protein